MLPLSLLRERVGRGSPNWAQTYISKSSYKNFPEEKR